MRRSVDASIWVRRFNPVLHAPLSVGRCAVSSASLLLCIMLASWNLPAWPIGFYGTAPLLLPIFSTTKAAVFQLHTSVLSAGLALRMYALRLVPKHLLLECPCSSDNASRSHRYNAPFAACFYSLSLLCIKFDASRNWMGLVYAHSSLSSLTYNCRQGPEGILLGCGNGE